MAKDWDEIVTKKAEAEFMKFGIYTATADPIVFGLVKLFKDAKKTTAGMANSIYNNFFIEGTGSIEETGYAVNWQGVTKDKITAAWKTENGKLLKNFANKAVLAKIGADAPAPKDLFDGFVTLLAGGLKDMVGEFKVGTAATGQDRVKNMEKAMKANNLKAWEPYRAKLEKVGFTIAKVS